uniref:Uncharacterized protein n=1 Tax=Eutreptiella gymnastica TaxID=73025 RepID=A0A7S4CIR2_9EUGL|mmetsp:Transcript_82642/g.138173  ORF Transcript_82642/g.138173 Transcript_82642/m.138173 type:complete len:139 (+) Transcript_82642:373-789(+)
MHHGTLHVSSLEITHLSCLRRWDQRNKRDSSFGVWRVPNPWRSLVLEGGGSARGLDGWMDEWRVRYWASRASQAPCWRLLQRLTPSLGVLPHSPSACLCSGAAPPHTSLITACPVDPGQRMRQTVRLQRQRRQSNPKD